jgi:peptidoglycan/LPS O-acetylase OafA/YrhL
MILSGAEFEAVHPLLPARADDLALGVLAAIIFRTKSISFWIKANPWALYSVAGIALVIMIALVKWANWKLVSSLGYSAYAIFYFCFILSVLLLPNPRVRRFLNHAWLRWLGTTSYCIYLAHEGIRYALFDAFGLQPVITNVFSLSVCVAALILTLAIAQISWVLIERPLMRRAHARFAY